MALGIGPTFKCYIHAVGMRSQNFWLSAVSTDIIATGESHAGMMVNTRANPSTMCMVICLSQER